MKHILCRKTMILLLATMLFVATAVFISCAHVSNEIDLETWKTVLNFDEIDNFELELKEGDMGILYKFDQDVVYMCVTYTESDGQISRREIYEQFEEDSVVRYEQYDNVWEKFHYNLLYSDIEDAKIYLSLLEEVRDDFDQAVFNSETGYYVVEKQTLESLELDEDLYDYVYFYIKIENNKLIEAKMVIHFPNYEQYEASITITNIGTTNIILPDAIEHEHVFDIITSLGVNWGHSIRCRCGSGTVEEHNFVDNICVVCGETHEHYWYCSNSDNEYHEMRCYYCSNTRTEPHNGVWNGYSDFTLHEIQCLECGFRWVEDHQYNEDKICTVCGYQGHDMQLVEGFEATCTESGSMWYWHCTICNKNFEDPEGYVELTSTEIPAYGHSPVNYNDIQATCTQDGQKDGTYCWVCNEELEAPTIIPALGHNPTTRKGYAATCLSDGLTDYVYCSVCYAVIEEQKIIPALGHDWDEWKADNNSSSCFNGTETRVCNRCNSEETNLKSGSAKGHLYMGNYYYGPLEIADVIYDYDDGFFIFDNLTHNCNEMLWAHFTCETCEGEIIIHIRGPHDYGPDGVCQICGEQSTTSIANTNYEQLVYCVEISNDKSKYILA